MKKNGNRALAKRVTIALSAGMIFQSAQCTLNEQNLLTGLVNSIATVFITDYVFDQFNVSQSPFGF